MLEIPHTRYRRFLSGRRPWLAAFVAIVLFAVTACGLLVGYHWALRPVEPQARGAVRFIVSEGESSRDIADNLKQAGLIRSRTAFRIYADLNDAKDKLQVGSYALSRTMSVAAIVEYLSGGRRDEVNITILPGMTLRDLADDSGDGSLVRQGFFAEDIEQAFEATYDHPLLASKPTAADLEGYVYPETYRVRADAGVQALLLRSFDEFYEVIRDNGIEARLAARGLTLHQGLTLASIIQQEVHSESDQKQVAQVFLKRLAEDMPLGSDPTFIYAAERDGRTPTINYDSPYNTRRYKGLPPGPIGTFNLSALLAVADPASGDYLYFAAGDDGVTRFARTLEEHEDNVSRYGQDRSREFSY